MPKRRILVLLAALAAAFGIVALVLQPKPEPEYGGKKLSEWVMELDGLGGREAPKDAIREIGTNALPYLTEWIGYETPRWKGYVFHVATRILTNTRWKFAEQNRLFRRQGAMYAFTTLGTNAEREIANLSSIANDPKRPMSRFCAMQALQGMGAASLPAIVGILTNEQSRTVKSSNVRIICARYMTSFAEKDLTTVQLAEPALLRMCEDSDRWVRFSATNALITLEEMGVDSLRNARGF